jgi:uncharacterized membrane protein YfcA
MSDKQQLREAMVLPVVAFLSGIAVCVYAAAHGVLWQALVGGVPCVLLGAVVCPLVGHLERYS